VNGIELIAQERQRQIEKEGWTPEHDDQHVNGELAIAACCYATPIEIRARLPVCEPGDVFTKLAWRDPWPWEAEWDKRETHDRLRSLIIAGALIAAEIDRLKRAATPTPAADPAE